MTAAIIYAAATIFGPASIDPVGNPSDSLACARALYGAPRRLQLADLVAASYVWPCGTWLDVCATTETDSRCVRVRVEDRGPRRARPCLDRWPDPKCSVRNPIATDLDLSVGAGVALGIGDWQGRPTRACRSIHGRGCAVTYSAAQVRA